MQLVWKIRKQDYGVIDPRLGKGKDPALGARCPEMSRSETERKRIGRSWVDSPNPILAGGFKYFFNFHPYLGKIPILANIFQRGWNHQPV